MTPHIIKKTFLGVWDWTNSLAATPLFPMSFIPAFFFRIQRTKIAMENLFRSVPSWCQSISNGYNIVIVLWLFFHGQIPIVSQMCREQHSATAPWGAAGGKSAPQSFPVKAWAWRENAKRRKLLGTGKSRQPGRFRLKKHLDDCRWL